MRLISHSEAASLLTCQHQWGLRYSDVIVGSALRPKNIAPILREGRAWGAAVANWHQTGQLLAAYGALTRQLDEDAAQQKTQGVYLPDEHERMREHLAGCLAHYAGTAERMEVHGLEREIVVSIPSRTGRRASSKYQLQAFVDAVHRDSEGRTWIVEFKLRGQLSSLEQISIGRQIRRYAYAYWQKTGVMPAGVIVDERLNDVPKPPRLVKAKRKSDPQDAEGKTPSHAVDQLCTAEAYVALCRDYGVRPTEDTEVALRARRWQQRHLVLLRPLELAETGRELVSLGQQIIGFESGELLPVRNPSPRTCPGCAFREICADPADVDLVDALFERVPAKRDRELIGIAA